MARLFATVGDNCIDRYMPPIGHSTVGGNAVNVAAQVAGMGLPSACYTSVGGDEAGRRTIEVLRRAGVDVSGIRIRPGHPTAWTDITIDPTGERRIGFEEFGACRDYAPDKDEMDRLRQARHVHLGWMDDGGGTARALSAAGVPLSVDIAVNPLVLPGMTVFVSAAFDKADGIVRRALAEGAARVVVTLGPDGALLVDGAQRLRSRAEPVAVLDTLGAGDSFAAGFLVAQLAGRPDADCLTAGHGAAALTCAHWGGFPQRTEPL